MYCMEAKYQAMVCEQDGWLFTLRKGKSTDKERVYLFPLGDTADTDGLRKALTAIMEDAHENRCSVRFETITENAAKSLKELFPNQFAIEPSRDWYEYIYNFNTLANLPGGKLASKRYDIQTFYRDYEGRAVVRKIQPDDIDSILRFQRTWLTEKQHIDEDVQLDYENLAIQKGLAHFEALGLSGIVVIIDGELCGYAYGAPLSDTAYDVIIEKGDRRYNDIYKIAEKAGYTGSIEVTYKITPFPVTVYTGSATKAYDGSKLVKLDEWVPEELVNGETIQVIAKGEQTEVGTS